MYLTIVGLSSAVLLGKIQTQYQHKISCWFEFGPKNIADLNNTGNSSLTDMTDELSHVVAQIEADYGYRVIANIVNMEILIHTFKTCHTPQKYISSQTIRLIQILNPFTSFMNIVGSPPLGADLGVYISSLL